MGMFLGQAELPVRRTVRSGSRLRHAAREEKGMAYIDTVSEDEATGDTALLYEQERERVGFVPNLARVFGSRPDAYRGFRALNATIQGSMDLRPFEPATLAAARR